MGDTQVMLGQLDRLLTFLSLPRIRLGIIPATATYQAPTNQFIMFDERMVHVETVSAELAITQPREIALYAKTFHQLSQQALYGQAAKEMINDRLTNLRKIQGVGIK